MSFILDALQKDQVEQQSQPAAVPPGMLPPSRHSPAKRWGLGLLAVALLVNAGVLAWYLLGQNSSDGASGGSNVAPSVEGAQRELAMGPPSRSRAEPTPSSQTINPSAVDNIPKRTPDRSAARKPVAKPTRQATREATRPRATPSPAPVASPRSPTSTGGGRVLSPEQAAQMGIGEGLLDAPPKPKATTQPKSARIANSITVAELPTAARNSFPALEFSTHIFADDPSMRAIVVNDKRLIEGEQLGELILRAVTEDGVVFGYRNHLVAVSVVDLWAE